jgi:molybdopterin converting factor small subunit
MASITVKFYSLWNLYLNKKSVEIYADDLDDAMKKLDKIFGEELRKKLLNNRIQFNNFKDSSTILLNGISLRNLKNHGLKDGDILHVFPPIAGG